VLCVCWIYIFTCMACICISHLYLNWLQKAIRQCVGELESLLRAAKHEVHHQPELRVPQGVTASASGEVPYLRELIPRKPGAFEDLKSSWIERRRGGEEE
jgi:hypothetical protein